MFAGNVIGMRTATNNPFEPGSDRIPQVWAGRQEQLADWRDRLRPRRAGRLYERGRTLLGEPGIGKSVLVRRLAADAARTGDLVTDQIRLPRGVDPLPMLAEHVLMLADTAGLPSRREKAIRSLIDRVRQVSVAGTSLRVDRPAAGQPPHVAVTRLLVEVGRAAAADDRVVVVHVDEVQNVTDDDSMSQLLVVLGDALAHEDRVEVPGGATIHAVLPLVVFLTALPEFADRASTRVGATFARRFLSVVLEPISDDDLHAALRPFVVDGWPVHDGQGGWAKVTFAPDAADRVVALCHGDPFLFQLAGQHAWDAGAGPIVSAAEVEAGWSRAAHEARRHVERALERLPEGERLLLEAMAALPPDQRTATAIARAAGYDEARQVGTALQRLDTFRGLISRGKPYTFRARAVGAYLDGGWP